MRTVRREYLGLMKKIPPQYWDKRMLEINEINFLLLITISHKGHYAIITKHDEKNTLEGRCK